MGRWSRPADQSNREDNGFRVPHHGIIVAIVSTRETLERREARNGFFFSQILPPRPLQPVHDDLGANLREAMRKASARGGAKISTASSLTGPTEKSHNAVKKGAA
jgi:hypothetical protein